jgi:hypothetical protein
MARRALRSLGGGLGLAGGQQWAQQPVVQLGVEDRDLDPVKGGGWGFACPSGCADGC